MSTLSLHALNGIASVKPGDDLPAILRQALTDNQLSCESGDVLVLAQKIVSKAENRFRNLGAVIPSRQALELAEKTQKDPRLVQLVLDESSAVIRACPGVLITRHRLGFVMANAGIDASNLNGDNEEVLLLPQDSDQSARELQTALHTLGIEAGIVIADSFGRPWREGVTNVAIGVAGLPALVDLRETPDRTGRALQVTQVASADLIASAAGLLMGEANESVPAVLVKGIPAAYLALSRTNPGTESSLAEWRATDLVRPIEQDLFAR